MKSKLGFLIHTQEHTGQIEKIIKAETKIIKIINNTSILRALYDALGSKTVFIARNDQITHSFSDYVGSETPAQAAHRWIDEMRPSMLQAPFAYWESFSALDDWSQMVRFAEFEAERQRLMVGQNLKACIGNFASGTPPISTPDGSSHADSWPHFYTALEAAHTFGSILGLQEYSGLWMDLYYGPNQSEALRSGGRSAFPEERQHGWLFGRYRQVWDRHIKPNGWNNIRVALTAIGLNSLGQPDIEVLAGYITGPWKTCGPAWDKLDGRQDSDVFYAEQLAWCDRQMQQDPYLIGGTVFAWGSLEGELDKFEIEGSVADKIITHIDTSRHDINDPSYPVNSSPDFSTLYITPIPEQGLRVRQSPNTDLPALGLVHPGDKLLVLETPEAANEKLGVTNQWIEVRTLEEIEGYVAAWLCGIYTGPTPTDSDPENLYVTPVEANGAEIIAGSMGSFTTLATAPLGELLEVLEPENEAIPKIGQRNKWLKVRTPQGINGMVSGERIKRANEPVKTDRLYLRTTASDGLKIRSGPSAQHDQITLIKPQDILEVIGDPEEVTAIIGQNSQWVHVRTPQGITGWAAAWFLEIVSGHIVSPIGHALVGLHGPADVGSWPWDEKAFNIIRTGRIRAVKVMSGGDISGNIVTRLRHENVQFVMARIHASFHVKVSLDQFISETASAAMRLYESGLRYFEILNEPNLRMPLAPEGLGLMWNNGKEFSDFFLAARQRFKALMPGAQFGFPGLSPGEDTDVRMASETFLTQAEQATQQADFICMHTYWGLGGKTYLESINEVETYCNRFPNSLIIVSEFANVNPNVGKDVKGREYTQFYLEARKLPPNLGAVMSFILSASTGFTDQTWLDSPIASRVGARSIL